MKKSLKLSILSATFVLMGFTMPSCPGQEAMEQRIAALETNKLDLTKKVQSLNAQVTSVNKDMGEMRQVLVQMTTVIQAQKGAIEQLEASINALKTHAKPSSKKK